MQKAQLKYTEKFFFDKKLFRDVKSFFNGEQGLDLAPYMYQEPPKEINYPYSGSNTWNDLITKEDDYYLYRKECELFFQKSEEISQLIPNCHTVVDLGPGSRDAVEGKTIPFMNSFKAIKSYIPVDVSQNFLKQSQNIIADYFPHITTTPVKADIYNFKTNTSYLDGTVFLFAGAAIMNTPEKDKRYFPKNTVSQLKKLHRVVGPKGYLVIGYDSNTDKESILKAYNNPHAQKLVSCFLHRIKWGLPNESFDPYGFECVAEWEKENGRIVYYAHAKKDQSFKIANSNIFVKNGDKFQVVCSNRYSVELFEKMASEAGFESVNYFQDEDKRMTLHVLRA